ncbi:MAG: type 4a pilus biogenesis protein PilO [bacterium]|nr:type 4a pilus biogenesis protein PilO [bacterium]
MLRKPIIIVVTLLATFVFIFLSILPKKDELRGLENIIQEKNQELRVRDDYFKELENASSSLEDYQSQLVKIKLALPEGPQVLVFYNFLQKAASRAGLFLKSINYGLSDPVNSGTQGLKIISLDLGAAGTIDGFRSFLSILEKSARMINIESFSFTSPEKEKDSVDFNVKIKAYFIE